jgi:hypothetical protein
VLLRAPELIDRKALDALPPNWATRNISERRAAGARTFPELGAPQANSGDPRRANPETGERLYAALGGFVAEEGRDSAALLIFVRVEVRRSVSIAVAGASAHADPL